MRLSLIPLISLISTVPALAALPPQYQRQAEFAAVLDVATETFGISRLIDGIEMTEPDVFSVRSGACTLIVRIVDTPQEHNAGWVGPREFSAVADALSC